MWFFSSRKNPRSKSAPARRPRTRPCLEMLEDRCVPSAGQLDPTFGSGGIVSTFLPTTATGKTSTSDSPHQVLVQSDGKILEVGEVDTTLANKTHITQIGLARYNANGSLDTSFGSGGIVVTDTGQGGVPQLLAEPRFSSS